MLVLARRSGESILIGDDVTITVLEVGRDQVRLGIRAPRSISVHREEVYREIVLANQAAAASDGQNSLGTVVPVTSLPARPR